MDINIYLDEYLQNRVKFAYYVQYLFSLELNLHSLPDEEVDGFFFLSFIEANCLFALMQWFSFSSLQLSAKTMEFKREWRKEKLSQIFKQVVTNILLSLRLPCPLFLISQS